MRRFLVVGCGGSGGKMLAYLMDQLRSDLGKHGLDDLPGGWQFVFVDVPSGVDNGPEGLGSVVDQGGTYVGMGPRGGRYADLDHAVSQQLRANGGLDGIATWAPREPNRVQKPIDVGAGQHRALGRMILLARSGEVRRALQDAYGRLFVRETHTEMAAAASAMHSSYDQNQPPLVIVLGSMAGGSGASMALDVCRLLTQVPGVNPGLIALFLVSADIFDSLHKSERSGVLANSLAMLGEIVASQTGSARRHDTAILGNLGLRDGEGTAIPFARVFPVGRSMGVEKALFGDGSMNAVYRGLARGLAGLMSSDIASQQFIDFDLGNAAAAPPNLNYLGWGALPESIPWGSYGFASLSMGRDRYAEYAAQRIARGCVDQLLDGHLQEGNQAVPGEQVAALLDSQWSGICDRIQLPLADGRQPDSDVGRWMMSTALPRDDAQHLARQVVDREFAPFLPAPQQQQAAHWRTALVQRAQDRQQPVRDALQSAAYEWAFRWQQELLERTQQEFGNGISTFGLAYAGALAERLRAHVKDVVAPAAHIVGRSTSADVTAIPHEVETALGMMKGVVTGAEAIATKTVDGVHRAATGNLYGRASTLTAEALSAFSADVLDPLYAAIKEAQRLLEQARASQVPHTGLARLATDHYAAWPTDDHLIPQRFDEANNEVLLTTTRQYDQWYTEHVSRAAQDSGRAGLASKLVAGMVVSGEWPTIQGQQAPGGLIELTSPWVARSFTRDPGSPHPLPPSEARFVVQTRSRDLLSRARLFVGRHDGAFDEFCTVSLRDYVSDQNVPESQREQRLADLTGKFREALGMALPLISADEQSVQALHGESVQYRYKFSAIPLQGLPVVDDLKRIVNDNRNVDSTSMANLNDALTDQGSPLRIDIFGSYPLYSPLAFDSVLEPVAGEWDALPPQGRTAYWTNRRARPLDASLAMSEAERRAMVAGWFLAQLIGELRIPEPPYTTPVQIFDRQLGRWISFPYPMLTMPDRFVVRYDWLPAVLESHLLAIAHAQQPPVMSSLRPYLVLRGMYDSTELGPAGGINEVAALTNLRSWLRDGSPSGAASRIPAVAAATSPEARASAATDWLTGSSGPRPVVRSYLPADDSGAVNGHYATISTREQASKTPPFRDLAEDVDWALGRLAELVTQAEASLGSAPNSGPVFDGPPEGGVF